MTINICYITDSSYFVPTLTSITSIKKNKFLESIYSISVIYNNLTELQLKSIKNLNDINFNIYLVKSNLDSKVNLKKTLVTNVTKTSLLKFSIPIILDKIDKVLYLDGDTIIQHDLTSLFSINIDNYLLAAVNDGPKKDSFSKFKFDKIDYFNSGVMLLNLSEIRKNDLVSKLIYFRENKKNSFMDQDSFNHVFKNRILFLPLKYNFMLHLFSPNFFKFGLNNLLDFYDIKNFSSISNLINEAYVIHYTFDKPWKYYDILCSDLWMKYYQVAIPNENLMISSYYGVLLNGASFNLGKLLLYIPSLLLKHKKGQFRIKSKRFE